VFLFFLCAYARILVKKLRYFYSATESQKKVNDGRVTFDSRKKEKNKKRKQTRDYEKLQHSDKS